MSTHTIFINWNNALFHKTIRLLLRHPDINIDGVTTGCTDAQTQIAKLHHDFVFGRLSFAKSLPFEAR